MYSEHGLTAVMRPDSGLVCQSLIVSSYWMPGSAHSQAALAILRNSSRASTVSMTSPVARARSPNSRALLDRAHELVGDADRVVGVLVLDARRCPAPPRSMSKPASRSARILSSSRALVSMNSTMSGWSTSRTTILAARRVAPPDLIVPADASAPRMKLTGPRGGAAGGQQLLATSGCADRFSAGAGAALEDQALFAVPVQDRVHRVVDGEDEARRHLLRGGGADVEPDRGVEAEDLVQQHPGQLVVEDLGVRRPSAK